MTSPTVESPTLTLEQIATRLGAGFLLYREYMQKRLRDQLGGIESTSPAAIQREADRIFATFIPSWNAMIVPVILGGYVHGVGETKFVLGHPFLLELAERYSYSLGLHLNQVSADALVRGYAAQVNRQIPLKLALANVIDAFGVSHKTMRSLVNTWAGKDNPRMSEVLFPSVKRDRANKIIAAAVDQRAKQVGEQESWNAKETGKQIAWMYAQKSGLIPEASTRVWVTAADELVCKHCGPLHMMELPIIDQFVVKGVGKFWSPPLHPNCRCHVEIKLNLMDSMFNDAVFGGFGRTWIHGVEEQVSDGIVEKAVCEICGQERYDEFDFCADCLEVSKMHHPKKHIVGFTGTRKGMTSEQRAGVESLLGKIKPTRVHHGGAVGADREFSASAKRSAIPALAYLPAKKESKSYLRRNREIVDNSTMLIAAPKSAKEELRSGTWATVRYARKTRTPITYVFPDGTIKRETPVSKADNDWETQPRQSGGRFGPRPDPRPFKEPEADEVAEAVAAAEAREIEEAAPKSFVDTANKPFTSRSFASPSFTDPTPAPRSFVDPTAFVDRSASFLAPASFTENQPFEDVTNAPPVRPSFVDPGIIPGEVVPGRKPPSVPADYRSTDVPMYGVLDSDYIFLKDQDVVITTATVDSDESSLLSAIKGIEDDADAEHLKNLRETRTDIVEAVETPPSAYTYRQREYTPEVLQQTIDWIRSSTHNRQYDQDKPIPVPVSAFFEPSTREEYPTSLVNEYIDELESDPASPVPMPSLMPMYTEMISASKIADKFDLWDHVEISTPRLVQVNVVKDADLHSHLNRPYATMSDEVFRLTSNSLVGVNLGGREFMAHPIEPKYDDE